MDFVLGTRAAIRGVGLLGDRRAGPLLLANWGKDPWISLEAAKAMGSCGIDEAIDPLIFLLQQTDKKNTSAWAARCLGEMLDSEAPSKLSRFITGSCYLDPVQPYGKWLNLSPGSGWIEREFQGLANPLLYWQILPRPLGQGLGPWEN